MVVVEQPHSPNGGSEFKCHARPNRLWGHPKDPLGGPGPHLSSPILPWFLPERRKSLFWPSGADIHPVGQKKGAKKGPSPQPATGMAGGDAQGALGTAGTTGRAGFAAVPRVPHGTPHAVPPNAASRRPRTE